MKKNNKKKSITVFFGMVVNIIYTVVFLFTLLITINALIGTLNNRQPSVFGYSVSKIMSESMEKDGFMKDDYVITKKVRSVSDIQVADPANDIRGDVITFYVYADKSPVLEGDKDRSDSRVMFHEVVGVTAEGNFITKGSSNSTRDPFDIPFESVSGIYIETGAFAEFLIKAILAENRFLYWVIAVIALIALKQIFVFFRATGDVGLQREVMKGKRNLLDKKCFERNIFKDFNDKSKKKLILGAPNGLGTLYEYILCGRVTEFSDLDTTKMVEGKRCSIDDVLCFTYAKEPKSEINAKEYASQLPKKKKKFEKYRNPAEFNRESRAEKASSLSLFIGAALFCIAYFVISFCINYFPIVIWYELLAVVALPLLTLFYLVIVLSENASTAKQLKRYLEISTQLPERYQFIINPDSYSENEINRNFYEICAHLGSKRQDSEQLETAEIKQPTDEQTEIEQSITAKTEQPIDEQTETEQTETEQPTDEQTEIEQSITAETEQPVDEQIEIEEIEIGQPADEQAEIEQSVTAETEQTVNVEIKHLIIAEIEQLVDEHIKNEQLESDQIETAQAEIEQSEEEQFEIEQLADEQPSGEQLETEFADERTEVGQPADGQLETEQSEAEQAKIEQPKTEQPATEESNFDDRVATKRTSGSPIGAKQSSGSPIGTKQSSGSPIGSNQTSGSPIGAKQSSGSSIGAKRTSGSPIGAKQDSGSSIGAKQSSGSPIGAKRVPPKRTSRKKDFRLSPFYEKEPY